MNLFGDQLSDLSGLGNFDIFAGTPLAGGPARRKKKPGLEESEAEGLVDSLLDRGGSLLSYAGSSLGKAFGGRAIRGALGGNPRELLSIIPFSDTVHLTDPEQEVTADQLLQRAGFVKPNDPTAWEPRDFAVPLVDALLDPGTFLTPFPKTAVGGALAKVGKMPRGLAAGIKGFEEYAPRLAAKGLSPSAIDQVAKSGLRVADDFATETIGNALGHTPLNPATIPLRGIAGFGLPFAEPSVVLGTGPKSAAFAGGLDWVGDAIKYAPGIRNLAPLFNYKVGRSSNKHIQKGFEQVGFPASDAIGNATRLAEYSGREKFGKLMEEVRNAIGGDIGGELETLGVIRQAAEGIHPTNIANELLNKSGRGSSKLGPVLAQALGDVLDLPANRNLIREIGSDLSGFNVNALAKARELGLSLNDLGDEYANYMSRRYLGAEPSLQESSRQFPTTTGQNIHRKKFLRDIPGGTASIDTWVQDSRLSGKGRTFADADVKQQVLGDMVGNLGRQPTQEEVLALGKKADQVTKFLKTVDVRHATEKLPYYSPNLFEDLALSGKRQASTSGAAQALYASLRPMVEGAGGPGTVPLKKLLKDIGLQNFKKYKDLDPTSLGLLQATGFANEAEARKAFSQFAKTKDPLLATKIASIPKPVRDLLNEYDLEGSWVQAYNAVADRTKPPDINQWNSTNVGELSKRLGKYSVRQEDADAARRFLRSWIAPTETEGPLKFFDSLQNLFKSHAYASWIPSHVRNLTGALYNNFLAGSNVEDAKAAIQLMRTGVLDPELARLYPGSDLVKRAYANGKVFAGVSDASDLLGQGFSNLNAERVVDSLPGQALPSRTGNILGDTALDYWEHGIKPLGTLGGANPINISGVGGRTVDKFGPVLAGRRIGTKVEDFARLQNFLGNIRRGYADDVAGRMVRDLHFDYSELAPFEKNVMRRLVPFYTFARKNLPLQLSTLANQPSRLTIPLRIAEAANGGAYVPEYMQGASAIALGKEQDGTQRFVSSLGLPFEEALGRIKMRNGYVDPSATALSYMGALNPFIKGPLEQLFDTQFHTGRKLSDLRPTGVGSLFGALDENSSQVLAQVLANTPATRTVSAIDKLIDSRKGLLPKALNLLTGVKVSDVNMEKMRAIDAREAIGKVLQSNPAISEFTNYYVKPEDVGRVTPEDQVMLELFKYLRGKAKAAVTKERLEKVGGPGL